MSATLIYATLPSMVRLPLSKSGRSAGQVAIEMAMLAGDIIAANFQARRRIEVKGRGNIVTDVDLQVEEKLISVIMKEYPDHGILAEETANKAGDFEYLWVIDPLDGTRNYASHIPIFSMTVALMRDNDLLLGITYDPMRREMFRAEKGAGAFLNDAPISVSQNLLLREAIIGLDLGYSDERGTQALKLASALWPGIQSLRIIGSAALGLAYVACGRMDVYFHHLIYPWDIASGILLVREAGGNITDRNGDPVSIHSRGVVASNAAIHADFMHVAQKFPWEST